MTQNILVKPSIISVNRSANQRLACTVSAPAWTTTTVLTTSGVAGLTMTQEIFLSSTAINIVVLTTGSASGTAVVSDGTNHGSFLVQAKSPVKYKWILQGRDGNHGPHRDREL
jgi:hypothetical protein